MAEQTVPGSLVAPEDAGRIDSHRTGRLIMILVALVLYSEVAPMHIGAISIIVPKIATSFPAAGANVTLMMEALRVPTLPSPVVHRGQTARCGRPWGKPMRSSRALAGGAPSTETRFRFVRTTIHLFGEARRRGPDGRRGVPASAVEANRIR